jgi:hypothetical protein
MSAKRSNVCQSINTSKTLLKIRWKHYVWLWCLATMQNNAMQCNAMQCDSITRCYAMSYNVLLRHVWKDEICADAIHFANVQKSTLHHWQNNIFLLKMAIACLYLKLKLPKRFTDCRHDCYCEEKALAETPILEGVVIQNADSLLTRANHKVQKFLHFGS